MKTVEELLKPRWKVIADYPGSDFHIGEILDRDWGWVGNDEIGFQHQVSGFPHLFKRLEWWEDRAVEDMPEYVKGIGIFGDDKYAKVEWKINNEGEVSCCNLIFKDRTFFPASSTEGILPATEQEYLTYINQPHD